MEKYGSTLKRCRWKLTGVFFMIWAYGAVYCLKPLESLDELWMYNIAQEAAKGGVPYQDFSVIVTPVSFLVSGLLLRIFGYELLYLRILGAMVYAGICFLFFLILRLEIKKKGMPVIFTGMFCIAYGCEYTYDYNWLTLLEVMLLIYLQLRRLENPKTSGLKTIQLRRLENPEVSGLKTVQLRGLELLRLCYRGKRHKGYLSSFGIGILGGMAFLTKQSTGLCVVSAVLVIAFMDSRKRREKGYIYTLAGSILVSGFCFLWLAVTGAGEEFRAYCFGGLGSFSGKNRVGLWEFVQRGGIFAALELGVIGIVTATALYRAYRNPSKRRSFLLMLSYAFSAGIVVYPIMDDAHFQVALVPFLVMGAILLSDICREVSRREAAAAALALTGLAIAVPVLHLQEENVHWSELEHFRGIRVNVEVEERVKTVAAYIGEEDSYIIDASAALYHIPMGVYHKNYDMFNNGNFGMASSLDLVNQLRGREGWILILKEEYSLNWQTPVEAVQFIREHYTRVDEVSCFDVYRAAL